MAKLTSTYAYIEALSLGGPPPSQLPALKEAFDAAIESSGVRGRGSGSGSKASDTTCRSGPPPVLASGIRPLQRQRDQKGSLPKSDDRGPHGEDPLVPATAVEGMPYSEARLPRTKRPPPVVGARTSGEVEVVGKSKRSKKMVTEEDLSVTVNEETVPGAPSADAAVALLMMVEGEGDKAPRPASKLLPSSMARRRGGVGLVGRDLSSVEDPAAMPPPAAAMLTREKPAARDRLSAGSPPDIDPQGGSSGGGGGSGSVERRIPGRLLPWSCPRCTLHNSGTAKKCGACKLRREAVSTGTWQQAPLPQPPVPPNHQVPGRSDPEVDLNDHPPVGTSSGKRRVTGATIAPTPTPAAVKSAGPTVKRRLSSSLLPAAGAGAAAAVLASARDTLGQEDNPVGKTNKASSAPPGKAAAISSSAASWASAAVSAGWVLLGSGLDDADKVSLA